jgi:hypothetical protein
VGASRAPAPVGAAALAAGIGYRSVYVSFLVVAALSWACVATYIGLAGHCIMVRPVACGWCQLALSMRPEI